MTVTYNINAKYLHTNLFRTNTSYSGLHVFSSYISSQKRLACKRPIILLSPVPKVPTFATNSLWPERESSNRVQNCFLVKIFLKLEHNTALNIEKEGKLLINLSETVRLEPNTVNISWTHVSICRIAWKIVKSLLLRKYCVIQSFISIFSNAELKMAIGKFRAKLLRVICSK